MWHVFRLTIVSMCLGCWTQPIEAADSPARLIEGKRSIEELLRLPLNLQPGRYTVHCEAYIMRTGNAPQAFCYPLQHPAPVDLVYAVTRAAARATFAPAIRGGRAIEVYAVFMVLIDTTLAEPMILAVPNNGVERRKYGLLYTSPQRIVNRPNYTILKQTYLGQRATKLVMMRFHIDEHGNVVDSVLDNITGESGVTLRRYERTMREYRFLPGYHDGRPMAMMYVEPYFSATKDARDPEFRF